MTTDTRDFQPSRYTGVINGSVFFNAIMPKMKCAGWHAVSSESTIEGTCACCGSTCIALADWIGPDYRTDQTQRRWFIICMESFHVVEEISVLEGDPWPKGVLLYGTIPLFETCPPDEETDGQS